MNREQRRAEKHKRGRTFDRNEAHRESCKATMPLLLCRPYEYAQVAAISIDLRMSWQALVDGRGTDLDFANVAQASNVCCVRAEEILAQALVESDKLPKDDLAAKQVLLARDALAMCVDASKALLMIRDRKNRLGKLGVCAHTLQHIPPMIDFHDQLCELSNIGEMVKAQAETVRRMKKMEKTTCSKT